MIFYFIHILTVHSTFFSVQKQIMASLTDIREESSPKKKRKTYESNDGPNVGYKEMLKLSSDSYARPCLKRVHENEQIMARTTEIREKSPPRKKIKYMNLMYDQMLDVKRSFIPVQIHIYLGQICQTNIRKVKMKMNR